MTSRRHWLILVALFVLLSLFLVACVRPLPGDDETLPTATPVEASSSSQPEFYPGPSAVESEETSAESYPAGETAEGEHVEGEAAEGEHAEGEAAEGEAAEGEAAEGEAAETSTATEAVETGRTHTVAPGDTLFRIGMQYGMSWVALAQANDITNPNSLYVGQVLVIPDVETLEASEASAEETEEVETEEAETEISAAFEASEIPAEGEVLTVYVGPELKDCVGVGPQTCMQVKTSPDDDYIFFYDNIEGFEYEPGYDYELLVLVEPVENAPADASTLKYSLVEEVSKAPASTDEVETEEAESEEIETEETTYIVQSGDTLYAISYRFGISMMEIARENELASFNQIYAGQELVIPQAETEEEADEEVEEEATTNDGTEATHVVEEGETVFTISFDYGIAWTKLVGANEIASPYTLEVGQTLIIPSGE